MKIGNIRNEYKKAHNNTLKEQAASITVAKILEICQLIPVLDNELDHTRGQTKTTKDDAKFIFKNKSIIDILVASERSRGQRRNAGLLEECILIDGDMLNDVLIPKHVKRWGIIVRIIMKTV